MSKKKAAKKKVLPKKRKKVVSKRVRLVSAKEADNVIDQIRVAFSVSVIGSMVGIVLGSAIPLTTYVLTHYEWKEWVSIYTVLIAGGLAFSFKNVYQWGQAAFRDGWKAVGFVALIEGSMLFSQINWVNILGLSILIGINAIASGANLVLRPVVKKPIWER